MNQEERKVQFDSQLCIEAYQFQGIMQKFPNHFHEHYVIGFIESGVRRLTTKTRDEIIHTGDLILFNPYDNHTCQQADNFPLDYRCLNISEESMAKAVLEITGHSDLPYFTECILFQNELVSPLYELHKMIMDQNQSLQKEELFYFLIGQLLMDYTNEKTEPPSISLSIEIQMVCEYLEKNYKKAVCLDELSSLTGKSKYHLLRSFTKQKGISPYSYLETIRINRARKLLEQGTPPAEAAFETGFTDQSHFTNFFKKFIGLTPKQYQNIFIK